MADARNTPTHVLSQRRAFIGALAVMALAPAAEAAQDPHVAWEDAIGILRRQLVDAVLSDDQDAPAIYAQVDAIEAKIALTPATTPAGIAVQLRLVLREGQDGVTFLSDLASAAIRNAVLALGRIQ